MGNSDWWRKKGPTGPRDGVTESSLRFVMLGYQLDRSQGWVLVGRGRWNCPGSVCTMFRRVPGRGLPEGLPFPPPSLGKMKAPALSTKFPWRWRVYGGELLGGKGVGAGGQAHPPLASEVGASQGPLGHRSLVSLSCGFPSPPGQPCPLQRWGLRRGRVGRVTKGLHSPPSSSTNVDEVVSQGSWEAHFLFRPQDFPRQPPPGYPRAPRAPP